FLQEAKTVSALNHPHIITIYEVGEVDSTSFIATEFIEGRTLREVINSKQMPLDKIIEIAIQSASALTAAHEVNIVHRDIKPENIMLRDDGYVKVLDFGLAKLLDQSNSNPEASTLVHTADGVVLGTVSYMSPEQARGLEVDARTDIWSFGAVVYEMVTGRRPFEGTTLSDILAAVLDHEPTPVARYSPDAPAELERIIRKALAKNPEQRYQTSRDLLNDLQDLKREIERQKIVSTVASPPTKSESRSPLLSSKVLLVAGAVVLLIGSVAYLFRDRLSGRTNASNEPITLAVLPFLPLSPAEEIGFLSTGLPDAIITRLANVRQIRVRPTSTILKYEGKKVSAQTVGQELACDYVVIGT